jgi:hypothetical protein
MASGSMKWGNFYYVTASGFYLGQRPFSGKKYGFWRTFGVVPCGAEKSAANERRWAPIRTNFMLRL